jgi:hypothetical protein
MGWFGADGGEKAVEGAIRRTGALTLDDEVARSACEMVVYAAYNSCR